MAALPADQRLPSHVVPDPSVMKLTRGHSCVLCQQRKVRCDKNKPCANCVKAGVECRVVPPLPPRRRKKKPRERELIDRLKKYESLLSQHGVNFDPIGDIKPSDSAAADEFDDLEHGMDGLKTSPSSTGHDPGSISDHPRDKLGRWFPYYKEFVGTDDLIRESRDSSDDESDGPMIHHAFDKMFDHQDGFPFVIGGSTTPVTELHPTGMQIFQLWQVYLNNVNPLLKLTHTPTLQGQIIEAAANTSKVPKPLEALMFSIYFVAITSMPEDEVQSMFSVDKTRLLSKYHHGAQQALINAGFMRSPDIIVLQAYFMYLLTVRQYVDPRSLYCLIGIAVRVAQRLGLHRDGEQFFLPPFEVELRRRLWWQLVAYDKRVAEMTGSTITALSSSRGDCKWPLNINDTDLHVHAKDRIQPYAGPTEMVFCLTRIELTTAAHPEGIRPLSHFNPLAHVNASGKTQFQYSPSPSSPDLVTHVANQTLPIGGGLDAFCDYMENTYLKHCDPKIPLHFFTLMMTRENICKLRCIDYMSKTANGNNHEPNPDGSTPAAPDPAERDFIVLQAVRTLEYDSIIQSTESTRGFVWYTFLHFPFPAYILLVNELRTLTTGELCDRGWAAIVENHERRGLLKNPWSPMHIALGSLMLKAWDAYETAQAQLGRSVERPKLVGTLRDRARKLSAQRREAAAASSSGSSAEGAGGADAAAGTTSNVPGAGVFPSQQQQQDLDMSSASHMVNMDASNAMFPTFDGINQHMFSSALPGDMDFGQMDWSSLMQGWTGYPAPGAEQLYTHTNTMHAMPGPGPR